MSEKPDLPRLAFESQAAWRTWLAENHETVPGIWLQIAKQGRGISSVTYAEALDVALCYGWIDGQKGALDHDYWVQRFTPRKARSKWSRINRDRATQLLEQGAVAPAGLREIERARADGRWDAAYEGQRVATVPEDLQQALDQNERARAFFETLSSANRYAILYRVADAKRPETRARRIAQFIEMLAEHRTIHP